jgi:predicted RNA binding protein YcfA (HicA-like mRNA interferase family)
MPNNLRNWTYRDVIQFLKDNGFTFGRELVGSHETWVNATTQSVVNVNKTKSSYPFKTLETMVRQSKVSKKDWVSWAGQ